MGHEDRLRWVRIRLLPHPGLLCFNIQLAKLKVGKQTPKTHISEILFLVLEWKARGKDVPHPLADSYPVWDKVIQPQPVRIRVQFPTVLLVIDLWKFKGCDKKNKHIYA